MIARVREIDASPAVAVVDLIGLRALGVSPVRHTLFEDPTESVVELSLGHQEREVHAGYVTRGVSKVDSYAVSRLHLDEVTEGQRRLQPEHIGEEPRRLVLVVRPDDEVIQLGHHARRLGLGPVGGLRTDRVNRIDKEEAELQA
jgi:hypothetical protein